MDNSSRLFFCLYEGSTLGSFRLGNIKIFVSNVNFEMYEYVWLRFVNIFLNKILIKINFD